MVRRSQRASRGRRASSLLAKTHSRLPRKSSRPSQRNPHRRQQNFHLSRRRPPLLPASSSRRNLHRLQPSLHAPQLPSLLPPRAKHLRLPLPRRHILSYRRRGPRRPPTQTSPATNPRTPRRRHRRQRLPANVRGTHPSRKSERLEKTISPAGFCTSQLSRPRPPSPSQSHPPEYPSTPARTRSANESRSNPPLPVPPAQNKFADPAPSNNSSHLSPGRRASNHPRSISKKPRCRRCSISCRSAAPRPSGCPEPQENSPPHSGKAAHPRHCCSPENPASRRYRNLPLPDPAPHAACENPRLPYASRPQNSHPRGFYK